MSDGMTRQQFLAMFVERAMSMIVRNIEGLTEEELHARPHENANSIGFAAWHIFRTADNIVHFVFERDQPIWLQQGLEEKWGLPKVDQGTGMDPEVAHGLRFPAAADLAQYGREVEAAVLERIEGMSDEYLDGKITLRPWGEITRLEVMGQTIYAHANVHQGEIDLALTMLGKSSSGM